MRLSTCSAAALVALVALVPTAPPAESQAAPTAQDGEPASAPAGPPTRRYGIARCGSLGCDSQAIATATKPAAGRSRGASEWSCTYTRLDLPANLTVYDDGTGVPVPTDGNGRWLSKECVGPGGARTSKSIYVGDRPPTDVRDEALGRLDLPAPEIRMSPRPDLDQIVHIRTFLWTDEALWRPQVSTVSVPGVSVTVRAVPEALDWDMGTGKEAAVHCTGPGRPWNPALPEDGQDTSCSFVYTRPSIGQPGLRYPVTATLRWQVSWSVTGAPGGGDLGTVSRSTTTSVRVIEVQTVNY